MNGESLRTLMAEVKLMINSRPLTVETISDSKSETLLSPGNLLTMKTSVVMPPPGEFSKPDAYSKRRILEQMENGISPESSSKADMEKEN